MFLNIGIQVGKVRNHSSRGVYWPGERDFNNVIVAVSVRIIALAVQALILRLTQLLAVQAM
jgi:hypothetical protein